MNAETLIKHLQTISPDKEVAVIDSDGYHWKICGFDSSDKDRNFINKSEAPDEAVLQIDTTS